MDNVDRTVYNFMTQALWSIKEKPRLGVIFFNNVDKFSKHQLYVLETVDKPVEEK